jgi:hypothetical protein
MNLWGDMYCINPVDNFRKNKYTDNSVKTIDCNSSNTNVNSNQESNNKKQILQPKKQQDISDRIARCSKQTRFLSILNNISLGVFGIALGFLLYKFNSNGSKDFFRDIFVLLFKNRYSNA